MWSSTYPTCVSKCMNSRRFVILEFAQAVPWRHGEQAVIAFHGPTRAALVRSTAAPTAAPCTPLLVGLWRPDATPRSAYNTRHALSTRALMRLTYLVLQQSKIRPVAVVPPVPSTVVLLALVLLVLLLT